MIALIVILLNWDELQSLPARGLLVAGFFSFLFGWVLTNLEAFLWMEALNLLEHLSQAAGGLLLAGWCWEVFGPAGEER